PHQRGLAGTAGSDHGQKTLPFQKCNHLGDVRVSAKEAPGVFGVVGTQARKRLIERRRGTHSRASPPCTCRTKFSSADRSFAAISLQGGGRGLSGGTPDLATMARGGGFRLCRMLAASVTFLRDSSDCSIHSSPQSP